MGRPEAVLATGDKVVLQLLTAVALDGGPGSSAYGIRAVGGANLTLQGSPPLRTPASRGTDGANGVNGLRAATAAAVRRGMRHRVGGGGGEPGASPAGFPGGRGGRGGLERPRP